MGVMLRTVYAIVAAAIVSAAFLAFLSLSMNLEANAHVPGLKGDRADMRPLAANCSQHAWPYFEASCLRDSSKPFGQTRDVRLISTDRITVVAGNYRRPAPSTFHTGRNCAKSRAGSLARMIVL